MSKPQREHLLRLINTYNWLYDTTKNDAYFNMYLKLTNMYYGK